jgi:hypothetical protein
MHLLLGIRVSELADHELLESFVLHDALLALIHTELLHDLLDLRARALVTQRVQSGTQLLDIDGARLVLVELLELALDLGKLLGTTRKQKLSKPGRRLRRKTKAVNSRNTAELLGLDLIGEHLALGLQESNILLPLHVAVASRQRRVTVVFDASLVDLGLQSL